MKKILLSSLAIAMTGLIVSCGPSKEEMEAEAKRVADSIAAVEAEAKRVADEAAAAAAEAQRVADSTAAAEAAAKAAADSMEAAKNKKGGKKK